MPLIHQGTPGHPCLQRSNLPGFQRNSLFQPLSETYESSPPSHPSFRCLKVDRMAETNAASDVTDCCTGQRSGQLTKPGLHISFYRIQFTWDMFIKYVYGPGKDSGLIRCWFASSVSTRHVLRYQRHVCDVMGHVVDRS